MSRFLIENKKLIIMNLNIQI